MALIVIEMLRTAITSQPLRQLARIRVNKGFSQTELARRAGLPSQQTVSLLERGVPPADPDQVIRLAAVLGVEPQALWAPQLTICTSPSGNVTVKSGE
jgi:transcriptional regulator with XRE-family HTH domain